MTLNKLLAEVEDTISLLIFIIGTKALFQGCRSVHPQDIGNNDRSASDAVRCITRGGGVIAHAGLSGSRTEENRH